MGKDLAIQEAPKNPFKLDPCEIDRLRPIFELNIVLGVNVKDNHALLEVSKNRVVVREEDIARMSPRNKDLFARGDVPKLKTIMFGMIQRAVADQAVIALAALAFDDRRVGQDDREILSLLLAAAQQQIKDTHQLKMVCNIMADISGAAPPKQIGSGKKAKKKSGRGKKK